MDSQEQGCALLYCMVVWLIQIAECQSTQQLLSESWVLRWVAGWVPAGGKVGCRWVVNGLQVGFEWVLGRFFVGSW